MISRILVLKVLAEKSLILYHFGITPGIHHSMWMIQYYSGITPRHSPFRGKNICFVLLELNLSFMKDTAAFIDNFVHFRYLRMGMAFGWL